MKSLKFEHKGEVCQLKVLVFAQLPDHEHEVAENIRKFLTTQHQWREI